MSFLNNIVGEFTHQGANRPGGYPPSQQYPRQDYQGRPEPPAPWIAEWDGRENRWIFINRETGERTHNFPNQGGYNSGYNAGYGYGGDYRQQERYGESYNQYQQKPSHTGRNAALGAAAGLAGGALLMHEGHEIREKYDEDKYRAEYDADRAENWAGRRMEDGVQDVEDFPDDAARWTGRKVQEVEDIPEDIDRKWDNFKQDVEDVPDDIAQDVGNVAGRFDRFGDGVENAYDDGRYETRYDDDNGY